MLETPAALCFFKGLSAFCESLSLVMPRVPPWRAGEQVAQNMDFRGVWPGFKSCSLTHCSVLWRDL